jgi:hypothetical protein
MFSVAARHSLTNHSTPKISFSTVKAEILMAGSHAILQNIIKLEKLELSEIKSEFRFYLIQTAIDARRCGHYTHATEIINIFKNLFDVQTEKESQKDTCINPSPDQ